MFYAPSAISFLIRQLGLYPGKSVLDLAIGGRGITSALRASGASVVEADFHAVDLAVDFSSASFHAVVVAQSFDLMDGPWVLDRLHALLKPHGALALLWNWRDESVHWFAQIGQLLRPLEEVNGRYPQMFWRDAFDRSPTFTRLEFARFHHVRRGTPQDLIDVSPSGLRLQVERLLQSHRGTREAEQLDIPYRTDVYVGARI